MAKIKLSDICNPKQWKTIPTSDLLEEGYPVYGANGIIGYYSEFNHENPVVAVTCRGATCGSINITVPKAYVTGNAMCLDNVRSDIEMEYLYYCLKHYDFNKVISGSAQPQITRQGMNKIYITVCTHDEQISIVNKLKKVERVIELRKQELQSLDDLIKARFVEMFGSVHESTKYPYVSVKDLTNVISGGTPSRNKSEYWENGTIPWVKTTELENNIIVNVDEYITEAGLNGSSAKMVPVGTTLVAMYGQGKTRGMTAYLNIEACTNQACACILPSDRIDSMFMWKFFELSYENLRSLAQGAGQPNLNGNMIKNFQVLVPPVELQKAYVDFVKQVDKSKFGD